MVDDIIGYLEQYKENYDELIAVFPGKLPQEFYEKAYKAVHVNGPQATKELIVLLSALDNNIQPLSEPCGYDEMIKYLKDNTIHIERLIEKSKTIENIVMLPKTGVNLHQTILLKLDHIRSTAQWAESYLRAAKIGS